MPFGFTPGTAAAEVALERQFLALPSADRSRYRKLLDSDDRAAALDVRGYGGDFQRRYLLLLTATPLQNDLMELFGLVTLLIALVNYVNLATARAAGFGTIVHEAVETTDATDAAALEAAIGERMGELVTREPRDQHHHDRREQRNRRPLVAAEEHAVASHSPRVCL